MLFLGPPGSEKPVVEAAAGSLRDPQTVVKMLRRIQHSHEIAKLIAASGYLDRELRRG